MEEIRADMEVTEDRGAGSEFYLDGEMDIPIEEQVLTVLRSLPAEKQREVLDFAEFLRGREPMSAAESAEELLPLPVLEGFVPEGWKDAIYDES